MIKMFLIVSALIIFSNSIFAAEFLSLERFGKKTIHVGDKKISAYIADEDREHAQGLMKVKKLEANEGMLFIFNRAETRVFWMKNTEIPLSIAFFDKHKKLLETLEMVPESPLHKNPTLYQSQQPAQYVLEMNANWFRKNKIKVGSTLKF